MIIVTIVSFVLAIGVTFLDVAMPIKIVVISVAAGLVVLGFFSDLPKPKFMKIIKPRHWLVLAMAVFLLVLNTAARMYEVVWDVSERRLYSLRQESVEWIGKLQAPVTVHVFLRSNEKTNAYINWLKKSAVDLGDKLDIRVHNINRDIELADRFEVRKAGEVVLESGTRWVRVDDFQEDTLVLGLARLFARGEQDICFVTGHGEPDIFDESPMGVSLVATTLKKLGYSVGTVTLQSKLPDLDKCSVLLVVGPTSDFFDNEIDHLTSLWGKKPMFFALGTSVLPSLDQFLASHGVSVGHKYLLDADNIAKQVPETDLLLHLSTAIGEFSQIGGSVFMPRVQALDLVADWTPILLTPSQYPIRENDGRSDGPFVVAAMLNTPEAEPISAVIGSNRPLLNVNWRHASNAAFITQLLRILLNETDIVIPQNNLVEEPIMSMSEHQATWISNISVYGLPFLVAMLCMLIWGVHRRDA